MHKRFYSLQYKQEVLAMTLQEHLEQIEPTTQISLCDSKQWHTENGSKIYDAFYVGLAKDAPTDAMQRIVIDKFTAFIWNTQTFILEEE